MGKPKKNIDVLIIGSGPAGLTAGIYSSRFKLSTLILEDEIVGGQIRDAYTIENWPGFMIISGTEFVEKMNTQVIASGAILDEFDRIISVKFTDNERLVETESTLYHAKVVIIAAGAKRRELPIPIPEEKKFHGNGIHYCELCDGHIYEGKEIAVVGGGNSALLAVKFLSKYAKKITIIQQFDYFQAETKIQDEVFANPKVHILWNSEVRHAAGDEKLSNLVIENVKTRQTSNLNLDGVFVYVGLTPRTDLYKEYITLDKYGYILAGETTETNVKGVLAAGDVRSKLFRQVTTAAGDGTVAALMAEKFINSTGEE
jgi:thioredoxin reductase (NADPH)